MSTFEVFNFKSIDRKPLIIGSLLFAVFLSSEISEFFSPLKYPLWDIMESMDINLFQ